MHVHVDGTCTSRVHVVHGEGEEFSDVAQFPQLLVRPGDRNFLSFSYVPVIDQTEPVSYQQSPPRRLVSRIVSGGQSNSLDFAALVEPGLLLQAVGADAPMPA